MKPSKAWKDQQWAGFESSNDIRIWTKQWAGFELKEEKEEHRSKEVKMLLEAHCRRALWFIFTVLIHGRLCPNTFIQPPCKHKDIWLEKWNVQVQRAMCTTLGSSGTSGWSSPPPPPPPQLHHLPLTHHHLDLYFCHQVLFTIKVFNHKTNHHQDNPQIQHNQYHTSTIITTVTTNQNKLLPRYNSSSSPSHYCNCDYITVWERL